MDSADLELFERSLRHATERHTGAALDAAFDALGWPDALTEDRRVAIELLFGLQGAKNVTSSSLDRVVVSALAIEPARPAVTGLVLPALGRWTPPGQLDGRVLRVAGLAAAALADRETAVVIARAGDDDVAIEVASSDLTLRSVRGIDPWLAMVEVTGSEVPVAAAPQPVSGWSSAVALAQLATGHELIGAARTMLDLARVHAMERIQFGQPISMFQAIRHRLADTLVAIETAEAMLDAAWLDGSASTAAMAKALAGRGARTTARHCQQVLAGIGFTTEHPLHRYVRRVVVLDELFGAARSLTQDLGRDVLATRSLPAQLPL